MAIPNVPQLQATFANARGDAAHLGPFNRLVFDGQKLKDGNQELIATHVGHMWELTTKARYSRFECYVPCTVWFETPSKSDRKSRKTGPFSALSAVGGVVYGDHRILAFCDIQLNDWYSFDFAQHYGCMVVVPHH
jgi:hypothetical protein